MTAAGMIDIHQHFGGLGGFAGSASAAGHSVEADCKGRLEFMDNFGIASVALMPSHSYNASRGITDIRSINDGLATYRDLAPDRICALFGTVDPRHGKACAAEVDRVHSMGFRGLSWHNRMQGLPMDHPVMFDIVGRMNAHGMAAMMHCYARGDFESPWRLRRLAERFPGTQFVALDAMTSPENLEELLGAAERNDNIYLDLTTTLLGARGVLRAIERIGSSRLVFGTNYYSMSKPGYIPALEAVNEAGLDEADRQAFLSGNAARLLGIG